LQDVQAIEVLQVLHSVLHAEQLVPLA